MAPQGTQADVQAVRRVYEDEDTTNSATSGRTIYIVTHLDTSLGRNIILWDDVLAAFKEDVIHIRSGAVVLPFLKGPDFKNLDPLRIAAIPNATIDVIVTKPQSEKKVLIETPQKTFPDATKASNTTSISTTNGSSATIRRNPVGGLVEKAMDAYRDNENPAFGPKLRGPQALVQEPSPSPARGTPLILQKSVPNAHTPSPRGSKFASNGGSYYTTKAKLDDKGGSNGINPNRRQGHDQENAALQVGHIDDHSSLLSDKEQQLYLKNGQHSDDHSGQLWTQEQYISWINRNLPESVEPVNDITLSLRSGVVLVRLIEQLSGAQVDKRIPNATYTLQMLENLLTAFSFMDRVGVSTDGYTVKDIFNGNEEKIVQMFESIRARFPHDNSQARNSRSHSQRNAPADSTPAAPTPAASTLSAPRTQ
ncbi:guanine nucleotide exchange factor 9 [Linnemannia zychae]|nr:guanine nucleotide exchange factor 9 [Linnemannia zychae]